MAPAHKPAFDLVMKGHSTSRLALNTGPSKSALSTAGHPIGSARRGRSEPLVSSARRSGCRTSFALINLDPLDRGPNDRNLTIV